MIPFNLSLFKIIQNFIRLLSHVVHYSDLSHPIRCLKTRVPSEQYGRFKFQIRCREMRTNKN